MALVKFFATPFFIICLFGLCAPVQALESDHNQPVLIEADEVDVDIATGHQVLSGNVFIKQGSIRITADEVELFFNGEQLIKAILQGTPAVFRQRPDHEPCDFVGQGQTIESDEIENIITFKGDASVQMGRNTIFGETIVYDMSRDKIEVRGSTRTLRAPEELTDCSPAVLK